MNIETIKVSKLKNNPNNPRVVNDDKFKKLVKSISEFPKMLEIRPIVVNEDFIVLGGNMRLKALRELGIKEVPIIKADELTEDQQREFIIKDNVGYGDWDWQQLASEWDTGELEDWGLDAPGDFFDEPIELEAKEDDYEIPEAIKTDVVEGDLIEIGPHKLLCGSSTETDTWAKLMDGKQADLVVTDPPYNVDYEGTAGKIMNDKMEDNTFYQFLYDFYTALGSYTKEGGAWYVWHADSEGVNFRKAMQDSGLLLKQCLIWVKNALVMGRQDYQWKHEPCLYGWKPGAAHYFTHERHHTTVIEDDTIDYTKMTKAELLKTVQEWTADTTPQSVIRCDKPRKNDVHPTMKPILLLSPLIENSSKEGELVADGFLGSGSTMVAAHQLKRTCYGMELDPKFCQVIIDRMRKLEPEIEVKINGKKYK